MGEISEQAKMYIDGAGSGNGIHGTWRLEILQKRIRADKDGRPVEGKEIPVRVRRFLKGIPWAFVHDAIRYLISQSPYSGIVYNGVDLGPGVKYRPTLTQWRRDDQEVVGGNAQGSYTLVQDLIEVTEGGDSFGAPSADSCSEAVETTWVWDNPEVEELPYSSEQGVTYAIQQVRRNDDGTFDYAIVKRVAKTQVSDETVVQCDEYETVYATVYDNVYGGEGGEPFRDDAGNPVALPHPCEDREAGVLVQVQKSQNPDCTFKLTVQRTVSKEGVQATERSVGLRGSQETVVTRNAPEPASFEGMGIGDRIRNELQPDGTYATTVVRASRESVGSTGTACRRDVFEHEHTEFENLADRPESPEAPDPGGGHSYETVVRATDEGTWDVTRKDSHEQFSGDAVVTRRKGLRSTVTTRTDRNTTNSSTSVSSIGDEVRVERTPGGLYNRTVTSVSRSAVGDAGASCRKTVFEHDHSDMSIRSSAPGSDVSAAGGGVYRERTSRLNEEGSWDVTDRTVTESSVPGARVVVQKTLRGTVRTETARNTSNKSTSVSRIGDRVEVEMTPGGRYNRTVTSVSLSPVGDTGATCRKTIYEHEHASMSNQASSPGADAKAASGGVIDEVSSRITEEGSWDVTRTVRTELPVTGSTVRVRKGIRGVVKTTTDRNVSDGTAVVSAVGEEVVVEKTPGGRYNRTVTSVQVDPVGDVSKSCSASVGTHTDMSVSNVPNGSQPEPYHVSPESNVEREVGVRMTDEGSWDVTSRTTVHSPLQASGSGGAFDRTDTVLAFANSRPVPGSSPQVNVDVDMSVSPNDYGTSNGTVRVSTYVPYSEYQRSPVGEYTSAGEKVELYTVKNFTRAPTVSDPGDGKAVERYSAVLNGHGSIDASWCIVSAPPFKQWESEINIDRMYSRTVWFRHATEAQYKDLVKSVVSEFNGKLGGWISADRPPTSHDEGASVTEEKYKNRYYGSVSVQARWSADAAGQNDDIDTIIAQCHANNSWRQEHHYIGRGRKKFEEVVSWTGVNADISIQGFSYRPDSTWSATVVIRPTD